MIELFRPELTVSPSLISAINIEKAKYASIHSSNGLQLAHLELNNEKAVNKLNTLLEELEKICIRDANYWIRLPNGSLVRKNSVLGFQCHNSSHNKGVVIRTQNNRILSFIPCEDSDSQLKIVQELHRAIEIKQPSQRYKPSWDFLNNVV